jgi:hypothetical protein
MGFLRRLIGGGERAPEWASFMRLDEYEEFIAAVEAELVGRGYTVSFTGDGGVDAQGGANPGMYGLFNLGQVCHANPRADWPGLIRSHFAHLEASAQAHDGPIDLETARPLLRLRAYRLSDNRPEVFERMIRVPLAEDLVMALAIDLPTTVRTTTQDDIDHWALPLDELVAIAASNMADEMRTYERQTIPTKAGSTIEASVGDTFFVSSQAYRFGDFVGDAPFGALIALPNRHLLLWHVIRDARATLDAVQAMVGIADGAYREGPGSLTPELYWWRDATWTRIPATVSKKGMDIAPPDAFVALLNTLS